MSKKKKLNACFMGSTLYKTLAQYPRQFRSYLSPGTAFLKPLGQFNTKYLGKLIRPWTGEWVEAGLRFKRELTQFSYKTSILESYGLL